MIEAWEEEQMSNLGCESVSDLIEEVKRLRERNDRLCEDLKRTRRWIQKQVRP